MMRGVALAALALGACAPQPVAENAAAGNIAGANAVEPAVTPVPAGLPLPGPPSGGYRCIDGSRMTVRFEGDRATITRMGMKLVLRRKTDRHYAAGGVSFEGKDDAMTFTQPGLPPLPCTAIRR